jgi:hypothetical protein
MNRRDNERSYQDDLNTLALSLLLGAPPFVAEPIDEDDEEGNDR